MDCHLSLVGKDRELLAASPLGKLYRTHSELEDERVGALFLRVALGTLPQNIVENH